ncbi:MAG: hypothetical protein WCF65_02055 [Parachlamydiaceae bacterium]
MESVTFNFFFHNWQRKLVALITAIVIWLFVNSSMNETVTIPNVTVRVINLPADKTIQGLLPNGILSRRMTLTLSGSKDVVSDLESGDLEVLLDASMADSDEWVVAVTKKDLVSLNPSIELTKSIRQVYHGEFVIWFSQLITVKIPVIIQTPTGVAPQGYEFLDIWPQHLLQTVSGAEEDVHWLMNEGLEMTFDLSDVTKAELDALKSSTRSDEVSFQIPSKWKKIEIPFRSNAIEDLNDPEASNLRIDFLRKDLIPFDKEIPVRIFYPLADLDKINPETYSLALSDEIQKKLGVTIFTKPLYVAEVSRLFLDIVRNSIEIVIVAVPKSQRKVLPWSVQFIQPRALEDIYVTYSIANSTTAKVKDAIPKEKEQLLRKRFRDYMQRMTLFLKTAKKLHIKSTIEDEQIKVVAY